MTPTAKLITGTIIVYLCAAISLAIWNSTLFFTLSASITLASIIVTLWMILGNAMEFPCPHPVTVIVVFIILNIGTYILLNG